MNIYIKTTENCNLNCLHCYNKKINEEIDYNKLKNFLNEIHNISKDNWFILHGGEPMMANLEQILNIVQEFSFEKWRISTNLCYKLTDTHIKIFKLMSEIRISFDVKIRFNSIRNLLLWKNNILYLSKNIKVPLFLNISITKHLLKHDPKQLLKMMQFFGITQFGLERITLKGNALENKDIIPKYEDVDKWLCKLYYDLKEYPNIKCLDIESLKQSISFNFNSCYGKECCCKTLTINSDGTIGNCPNNAHEVIFGNLSTNPSTIINNIHKQQHAIRKECLVCDVFKYCRGYCYQIEWQNDECPYPKLLIKEILHDEFSSKL